MATLTITISDEALARLQERADVQGLTPETLLSADAERGHADAGRNYSQPGAELAKLAGIIDSGLTDVGESHDYYLGQALADEMKGAYVDEPIR